VCYCHFKTNNPISLCISTHSHQLRSCANFMNRLLPDVTSSNISLVEPLPEVIFCGTLIHPAPAVCISPGILMTKPPDGNWFVWAQLYQVENTASPQANAMPSLTKVDSLDGICVRPVDIEGYVQFPDLRLCAIEGQQNWTAALRFVLCYSEMGQLQSIEQIAVFSKAFVVIASPSVTQQQHIAAQSMQVLPLLPLPGVSNYPHHQLGHMTPALLNTPPAVPVHHTRTATTNPASSTTRVYTADIPDSSMQQQQQSMSSYPPFSSKQVSMASLGVPRPPSGYVIVVIVVIVVILKRVQ